MEMNFTSEQIEFLRDKDLANVSIKDILEEVEQEYSRMFSFWDLITKYNIQIPIIQRDYAQGREDEKTMQIREGFVSSIYDCLMGGVNLHLDFIYGSAVDGAKLVLLDGQQRITTLFLLHWYIANRTKQISQFSDTFLKFSYQTRISSKDFCESLIKHPLDINEDNLSSRITNENWFFRSWQKDPTVKAMLVMIDAIHSKFKDWTGEQLEDAWIKLTENNIINFQFLDLEEFDLTDELYIKMNARGKALTEFENFKAWLIQKIEESKNVQESIKECLNVGEWQTKLDTVWTDLFWSHKAEDDFEIDNELMQYFKGMALANYAENLTASTLNEEQKALISKLNSSEYIPFSDYLKTEFIPSVDSCFKVLSYLENGNVQKLKVWLETENQSIFKTFIDKPNYWDRVIFYALVQFLLHKNQKPIDYDEKTIKQLKEWMRVCRNLIKNKAIEDQTDFIKSIQSIKELSLGWNNSGINCFYEYVSNDNTKIKFFTEIQREEEKLKARLIVDNNLWEDALIKVEKYEYFYGQIGFIIDFSTSNNDVSLGDFKTYSERAMSLFSESLTSDDLLLERALLTKGDYMPNRGISKYACLPSYGTLREREENWRRIFRDKTRCSYLKALLDDNRDLRSIIDEYSSDVSCWYDKFIRYPQLLKYSRTKLIRLSAENDIKVLKTTRLSGRHIDVFSYCFYVDNIKDKKEEYFPFTTEYYWENPNNQEKPCAVLSEWEYNSSSFAIDISYNVTNRDFELFFYDRKNTSIEAQLVDILNPLGFEGEDQLIAHVEDEDTLMVKLKSITSKLCDELNLQPNNILEYHE